MTIYNFDWSIFIQTAFEMSWFEVGMLLCFGASWPFSIHKVLKTGRCEGKSFVFLSLVMLGYLLGILHKLFFNLDVVIILYTLLFFVVMLDFIVSWKTKNASSTNNRNCNLDSEA